MPAVRKSLQGLSRERTIVSERLALLMATYSRHREYWVAEIRESQGISKTLSHCKPLALCIVLMARGGGMGCAKDRLLWISAMPCSASSKFRETN